VKFYFNDFLKQPEIKFHSAGPYLLKQIITIMSNVKQFEVKVQLKGGRTTTTVIFAENDYKARELVRMQFGAELTSIHYVREMR
jgi:hypothetical protein